MRATRLPSAARALGAVAALLLLGSPAPARSAPAAARVTAASPGAVRFEVEVPEPGLTPLADDPAAVQLDLQGYEPTGAAGAPGLPGRVLMVAVPPTGDVSVRATALDVSTREDVLLAPVPELESGENGVAPHYRRSAAAYAASGSVAPARARLAGIGWLRNQRVARILVLPADYDAAARRLTLCRRVEVEVAVRPVAPVETPAERIDPFERVYASLLVNYEQGRSWRRAAGRAGLEGLLGRPGARPLGGARVLAADTVNYAGREWIKLAISQTGMYKVDYGTLRNLRPFMGATVRTDDVRLYTWRSPLPVLPEEDYCDTCAYHEVPISIVDGGDGRFDNNSDYFTFFGLGPSDWANLYNPNRPDTSFFNHSFENRNYYYLTVSGAPWPIAGPPARIPLVTADVDTLTGPPDVPANVAERLHLEQSNKYYPDSPPVPFGTANASGTVDSLSWQKWFWTSLGPRQSYSTSADLPGADVSQPDSFRIRVRCWGLVNYVLNRASVSLNGNPPLSADWLYKGSFTFDTKLPGAQKTGNTILTAVSSSSGANSLVGLAWIDLFYPRRLEPVGDSLSFVTRTGAAREVYRIGPFTNPIPPRMFDVTDAYAPQEVVGFQYLALDATDHQLVFATDGTQARRYRIVSDSKIPRLLGGSVFEAPRTSLLDLRAIQADYLVIYFDGFGAAAESLAAWRHFHLPLEGVSAPYDTAAVPVSALFDQFSGGRTDPLAIRNFLRAVMIRQGGLVPGSGRKPSYVTLLGDASYDYRNFLGKAQPGQPACLLPTYENGYDAPVLGGHQFTTDDWLFNVDNAEVILPDFFGGRIPVSDAATAMDVVRNKLLQYERVAPFGEYRDRVMLIADDNFQCFPAPDAICWGHLLQTSTLDASHTPPHIDRQYVYLHTYPSSAGGCSKPGARAEIKQGLQDGVSIFNYIGHGSPFQLSDEAVFIETDVGTLTNAPRYPLFVAASCDVGLFNDPLRTSLGEKLVTTPGGGAIAVISATQLAFSTPNATLNGLIYDQLFNRDPASGNQYHQSIAASLLIAKEAAAGIGGLTNDVKYQLMGDAGTRLNLPQLWVELVFTDTLGAPISQITRGQQLGFAGRVLDSPNGNPVALNGNASVLIEDSPPNVQPPATGGCSNNFTYPYRAGPIYRADVAVVGGALRGRFIVPLEAREGAMGRIRAYATGRAAGQAVDTDAVGSIYVPVVPGAAPTGDNAGPSIALGFAGGAHEVRPDAVLNVDLFDPSGILITDHTPQNGIIVTLDDNSTTRVDITPSFRYAANSFQAGRATFQLPGLPAGAHRVSVSAADNLASGFGAAAHRSSAALDFQVLVAPKLNVSRAYLFPDPASSRGSARGGQFVVDAPGDTLNVLLRIYTVAGKLVRTLKSFGGFEQVQLPWDGLDDERQPLANGVYLFKVNVNARQPDGRSSPREHAIAEGRFVILNR